jgi:hypothetical protein
VTSADSIREFAESVNAGASIPPVTAADIKGYWEFWKQVEKKTNPQGPGRLAAHAVGVEVIAAHLTPGANVAAAGFRLGLLEMIVAHGMLTPWVRGEALDEAVYRVAAGYPFMGLKFDPEDFVAQVRALSE